MGRKRNNGLSEEKRNIIGQLIEMYPLSGTCRQAGIYLDFRVCF